MLNLSASIHYLPSADVTVPLLVSEPTNIITGDAGKVVETLVMHSRITSVYENDGYWS